MSDTTSSLRARGIVEASAAAGAIALALALFGARALSGEERYSVLVPDGLAFSEFKGYEGSQVVAVSNTEELMAVIVANPVMITAYQSGIPDSGKPFPDGSKDRQNSLEAEEEHRGARCHEHPRYARRCRLHREGQQAISQDRGLGLRAVQL